MKLFGKELFSKGKKGIQLHEDALEQIKKSDHLPDFYKDLGGGNGPAFIQFTDSWGSTQTLGGSSSSIATITNGMTPKKEEITKVDPKDRLTPKSVFEMKMLHSKEFKLKVDPEYVDGQVEDFKNRLDLIKMESFDMRNGLKEVASILMRLENRKKYPKFATFFEEFPYTLTNSVQELVEKHDYLKMGEMSQFVADLPREAVDVMKKYEKVTKEICGKKPVFYIIADKKDFQKTTKRRDPILLAQSPFGHVWQILGAWDKEMLLVDEL